MNTVEVNPNVLLVNIAAASMHLLSCWRHSGSTLVKQASDRLHWYDPTLDAEGLEAAELADLLDALVYADDAPVAAAIQALEFVAAVGRYADLAGLWLETVDEDRSTVPYLEAAEAHATVDESERWELHDGDTEPQIVVAVQSGEWMEFRLMPAPTPSSSSVRTRRRRVSAA